MRNTEREQRIAEALACEKCRDIAKYQHKHNPQLSVRQWTIALHFDWRTHASDAEEMAHHLARIMEWCEGFGFTDETEEGRRFLEDVAREMTGGEDDGMAWIANYLPNALAQLEDFNFIAQAHIDALHDAKSA